MNYKIYDIKSYNGWNKKRIESDFKTYTLNELIIILQNQQNGYHPRILKDGIYQFSTPEIIKYIINKEVDLECIDNYGMKPIHFICQFSTPEMIKYIIDKGVDLECKTNEKWKPIHLICYYSTPEMIKYIVDKGVNCNTNICKFDGKSVNYSLIDLINLRFTDNSIKQQYLDVLQKK